MGPEKGTQHSTRTKKKQPLSLNLCWGWGSFRRPSTALSPIFEQLFSLHYVSLRSRPPAEGKAENEDKKSFAKNVVASFLVRSSFSLGSGISLGTLFLTRWCYPFAWVSCLSWVWASFGTLLLISLLCLSFGLSCRPTWSLWVSFGYLLSLFFLPWSLGLS